MTAPQPAVHRGSSAAAKTARMVEIASHVDDTGARVHQISVTAAGFLYGLPGAPVASDVVEIQTDGPGFLALVDHLQLSVDSSEPDSYNLIDASGYVGLLELPVRVYSGRAETLAAGLVLS